MVEILVSISGIFIAAVFGMLFGLLKRAHDRFSSSRKALSDINMIAFAVLAKIDGYLQKRQVTNLDSVTIDEYVADPYVRERVDALISIEKENINAESYISGDDFSYFSNDYDPIRVHFFEDLLKEIDKSRRMYKIIRLRVDIEKHFQAADIKFGGIRFSHITEQRQRYVRIVAGEEAAEEYIKLQTLLNSIIHYPDKISNQKQTIAIEAAWRVYGNYPVDVPRIGNHLDDRQASAYRG